MSTWNLTNIAVGLTGANLSNDTGIIYFKPVVPASNPSTGAYLFCGTGGLSVHNVSGSTFVIGSGSSTGPTGPAGSSSDLGGVTGTAFTSTPQTLTLTATSQAVPSLSQAYVIPIGAPGYAMRVDYCVNLTGISADTQVVCYAQDGYGIGASSTQYMLQTMTGTNFSCSASGLILNYSSGTLPNRGPYQYTAGASGTMYIYILAVNASGSRTVSYYQGPAGASALITPASYISLQYIPI